jgi:hypothetical protein
LRAASCLFGHQVLLPVNHRPVNPTATSSQRGWSVSPPRENSLLSNFLYSILAPKGRDPQRK